MSLTTLQALVTKTSTFNGASVAVGALATYGTVFVNVTALSATAPGVPGTPTATPATTGGTLTAAASPYYYVVTATNGAGETTASGQVSATIASGTTGSVALAFTAVAGATGYKIYRGTTSGGESVFYTSATNSYTDTNASSTAGTPPATSTAGSSTVNPVAQIQIQSSEDGFVNDVKVEKLFSFVGPVGTVYPVGQTAHQYDMPQIRLGVAGAYLRVVLSELDLGGSVSYEAFLMQ